MASVEACKSLESNLEYGQWMYEVFREAEINVSHGERKDKDGAIVANGEEEMARCNISASDPITSHLLTLLSCYYASDNYTGPG